jgi:uncharacterized membrane protein
MLATIQFFDVIVALHIAAVVVAFGVTVVAPVAVPYIRNTNPAALPTWHGVQLRLDRFVTTPGMIVILLTGIYMASDRSLWDQTWVTVPLVIVVVLFGLVGAVFTPADRQLAALSERDLAAGGTLSEEYEKKAAQANNMGGLAWLLILVAIFFMVVKPFAG